MKRRKVHALDMERVNDVLDRSVKVIKENEFNDYFFEIGMEMTVDVAEAVSILIRKVDYDDPIWNMNIDSNVHIDVEKSLYWLSGGNSEWKSLINYNKPWCECCNEFKKEFGGLIESIVYRSNSLLEIRNEFLKYLNLPILYNFALEKNMIR